jgi:hypothetical protein
VPRFARADQLLRQLAADGKIRVRTSKTGPVVTLAPKLVGNGLKERSASEPHWPYGDPAGTNLPTAASAWQRYDEVPMCLCYLGRYAEEPEAAHANLATTRLPSRQDDRQDCATPQNDTAKSPPEKVGTPAPQAKGNAVFPTAVSPTYSKESAGKARMHTCLDQYKANKATGGNGGLNWIQKGGGYYSECNKRLKG